MKASLRTQSRLSPIRRARRLAVLKQLMPKQERFHTCPSWSITIREPLTIKPTKSAGQYPTTVLYSQVTIPSLSSSSSTCMVIRCKLRSSQSGQVQTQSVVLTQQDQVLCSSQIYYQLLSTLFPSTSSLSRTTMSGSSKDLKTLHL